MKGQPVVDAPQVPAHVKQAVPTLAVRVVGQQVEQRHPLEIAAMR
jgi:hypothetical protein